MNYNGIWRITEMDEWDKDYIDMEIPAHIQINGKNGEFQFGLVCGQISGGVTKYAREERYDFTFEGNDENDPTSGRGWLKLKEKDRAEGEFIFHEGDDSTFQAKRQRPRTKKIN